MNTSLSHDDIVYPPDSYKLLSAKDVSDWNMFVLLFYSWISFWQFIVSLQTGMRTLEDIRLLATAMLSSMQSVHLTEFFSWVTSLQCNTTIDSILKTMNSFGKQEQWNAWNKYLSGDHTLCEKHKSISNIIWNRLKFFQRELFSVAIAVETGNLFANWKTLSFVHYNHMFRFDLYRNFSC